MRTQDLVRVVMITRHEPLEICLVDRTLKFDRCTHDHSLPDPAPQVARHILRAPELSVP